MAIVDCAGVGRDRSICFIFSLFYSDIVICFTIFVVAVAAAAVVIVNFSASIAALDETIVCNYYCIIVELGAHNI